MGARLPSKPPQLSGLTYIRPLGEGGFADVYLFQQSTPQREVAVKVLRPEIVDAEVVAMFRREANHMAKLSPHPSILTIYSSGISADGRPFMLMEVCPTSLGKGFRKQPLPVGDVLNVGIKIASALETAHRELVLHRDIKPSNILKTTFGSYVLSDFGIAASIAQNASQQMFAMSVPWSSPEVVTEQTTGTITSEIWSLGATLYSLLAGHTPFEVADPDKNSRDHLKSRINKAQYSPINRADVPPELEHLLARSMTKDPHVRQQSMLEFAQDLQRIQHALGLPVTQLEVADHEWVAPAQAVSAGDESNWERHKVATNSTRKKRTSAVPAVNQGTTTQSAMKRPSKALIVTLAVIVGLGLIGFMSAVAIMNALGTL